ncbi:MAG: SLC13 family permease [Cryomorphaceae bacterium]|nr:SLC13 family permease [Flavobacteriales bacterium]
MDQYIVFGVLVLALVLFAWGRIRHDFVALIALCVLLVFGIIEPDKAFEGFGHPAVITVAAVLVIGKSLEFSGVVDLLGKWIMKLGTNITLQIVALSVLIAVASAFMNNVGALAIMMPIAIHMARKNGHPPSLFLMPIAFSSLLGGMTTLVGTPPNIIIATFRAAETGEPFGMFDFSPVGIVLTIAGLAFITLVGWRIIPKRATKNSDKDPFDIEDYITEVEVVEDSKLRGISISELETITKADVQILGLVRSKKHIHAPSFDEVFQLNDIIIIETEADELNVFIEDSGAKLVGNKKFRKDAEGSEKIAITEAIVVGDSALINRTASSLHMRRRFGINLLAIARRDKKLHNRLDHVRFQPGDVLLLQGREDILHDTITSIGCLPLAERELRLGYKTKIPMALGIFSAAIVLVVTNILPVQVAFTMAAIAMVLSSVLPLKEFYSSIDWPVIVLLGAMLPVGTALETTGGAQLIANAVLNLGDSIQPWAILGIILTVTLLLSGVINNAATVVLMAPIAIGVAEGLEFSVDPFLMAVAVGASCAFLTPIGHQSNTLVMGPGGYKFTDYTIMGLPLTIIIIILSVPAIMWAWPL